MTENDLKTFIARYKTWHELKEDRVKLFATLRRASEQVASWPKWKRNCSGFE